MPKQNPKSASPPPASPPPASQLPMPLPNLTKAHRMTYHIGRGETGVLTFEPYKSLILPLWRFRTPSIARQSSQQLYTQFLAYESAHDFIGMDMCRKFLQMGMTRAKRYANHKGGRKYDKESGRELEKSTGHEGQREKEEASLIFKEVWERCKQREGYIEEKEKFLKEQKEWERGLKREGKEVVNGCVKQKIKEEDKETSVKIEIKGEDEGDSVKKEIESE